MGFKCDLYCYESCDGTWTTHVAAFRTAPLIIPDAPWGLLVKRGPIGRYVWLWWHRLHMWSVGRSKRSPIGLPHDGETFKDDSPESFKQTLLMLRREGYHFPDYVLDIVDDEIASAAKAAEVDDGSLNSGDK